MQVVLQKIHTGSLISKPLILLSVMKEAWKCDNVDYHHLTLDILFIYETADCLDVSCMFATHLHALTHSV